MELETEPGLGESGLRLDVRRDEALASAVVADRGGLAQLRPLSDRAAAARSSARRDPARAAAGRGDPEREGDRRRRSRPRREPRPAPPALLRLHRLLRARDRRHRRRARRLLRREPRRLGRRRLRGRGAGRALGGRVRRLPGGGGLVHERRHGLEPDGARGGARAGAARGAARRHRRPAARDLLLPGGALLGRPGGRAARDRIGLGAGAADRRASAACAPTRSPRRSTPTARRASSRWRWWPPPGRRSPAPSTRSTSSPTCAPSVASGCTSTAPTACRPRVRPRPATLRGARARRLGRDRRPQVALPARSAAASCSCAAAPTCMRRSATRASTSRTTARSCTPPTSRSSTRGPSVRSSSGSRCGCTARTRSRRRSSGTCEQARLLHDAVLERPELEPLPAPPQLSIVPFRHVPPGVADVDAHNCAIVRRIQEGGEFWVAPRAHRRPHLHPALPRQLPHERGRRARLRGAGRADRPGARRMTTATALDQIDLTDLDRWVEGVPYEWFALMRQLRAPPLAGRARWQGLLVVHALRRHRRRLARRRDVLLRGRRHVAAGPEPGGGRAPQVDDRHRPAAAHAAARDRQPGLHAEGRARVRGADPRPRARDPRRAPSRRRSSTSWPTSRPSCRCGCSRRSWGCRSRTAGC